MAPAPNEVAAATRRAYQGAVLTALRGGEDEAAVAEALVAEGVPRAVAAEVVSQVATRIAVERLTAEHRDWILGEIAAGDPAAVREALAARAGIEPDVAQRVVTAATRGLDLPSPAFDRFDLRHLGAQTLAGLVLFGLGLHTTLASFAAASESGGGYYVAAWGATLGGALIAGLALLWLLEGVRSPVARAGIVALLVTLVAGTITVIVLTFLGAPASAPVPDYDDYRDRLQELRDDYDRKRRDIEQRHGRPGNRPGG